VGHVARKGVEQRVYVIGGKVIGKEPLGRPTRSWVGDIWMDLGEKGWGGGLD
jgi:hypothetical protein